MNNNRILIKNIYYMLSYIFPGFDQSIINKLDTEEFENVDQLLSYILDKSLDVLIKQGLYKEYINKEESMLKVSGKILINETIKNRCNNSDLINCEYSDLSTNNLLNKIIKRTIYYLIVKKDIFINTKINLKRKLNYFKEVELIDTLDHISWKQIKYNTNNKKYELIINICYMIHNNIIISKNDSDYKVLDLININLELIFEKFILNYFKKTYPNIKSSSKYIEWNVLNKEKNIEQENFIKLLPSMKTDIVLENSDNVLIIDTKFYSHIYSKHYNKQIFHSNNLYQIFAYVNNYKDKTKKVSGMLLYAKTIDENVEFSKSNINYNDYYISCIDLNEEFEYIKKYIHFLYKNIFS